MVSKLYKNQLIELSNNPYHFGKPEDIFSSKEDMMRALKIKFKSSVSIELL